MTAGDADVYCRLYIDPEVMRHIAAPLSTDAARNAFARALRQTGTAPPSARYWICSLLTDSTDCGLLALLPDRIQPASAEIGMLLLPQAQGRGLASEAIAALSDHAFSTTPLQQLWTRHDCRNAAAVGLMRTLGFRPGSATRERELRWRLCRDEWLASRHRR